MSKTTLRRIARVSKLALASVVIGACVTINVNFPAAETEKAADQIIDTVTGTMGAAQARQVHCTAVGTAHHPGAYKAPGFLVAALGNALYALIPAAQAQDANLDISTPEIRAITASMQCPLRPAAEVLRLRRAGHDTERPDRGS